MICRRCLLHLARPYPQYSRQFSSFPAKASAAEPFTVPPSMSPSVRGRVDGAPASQNDPITLQSSVPAGTPLKGLNIYKGKDDPVAMEDTEYPDWLWGVLGEIKGVGTGYGATSSSKKLSKKAAKRAANKAQVETGTTSIPISEQSVDLPTGDGTQSGVMQALDASKDLTKALRAKRRATIKEANFLKTMS